MKNPLCTFITLAVLIYLPKIACAQNISYEQLTKYEGSYEYFDHSTLQIAVSPVDTTLYAIINKSKYKLRFKEKDTFLNNANTSVIFLRDPSGKIKGYTTGKDTFRLINRDVPFSAANLVPPNDTQPPNL